MVRAHELVFALDPLTLRAGESSSQVPQSSVEVSERLG